MSRQGCKSYNFRARDRHFVKGSWGIIGRIVEMSKTALILIGGCVVQPACGQCRFLFLVLHGGKKAGREKWGYTWVRKICGKYKGLQAWEKQCCMGVKMGVDW